MLAVAGLAVAGHSEGDAADTCNHHRHSRVGLVVPQIPLLLVIMVLVLVQVVFDRKGSSRGVEKSGRT